MQEATSYFVPRKEIPYNGPMDAVRALVQQRAVELGKTLSALSKDIGRNHAYLQQFVKRGVPAALPEGVRAKLAKLLGVPESALRAPHERISELELTNAAAPLPTVKVVGYVGAAAAAHFYAVAQGELDEVPAPEGATPATVAVEIRGSSLGELFDRWLVFYDDVRRPMTPDLIGHLCVVGLADDRVLIKKIRRGANGLYDLLSNVEEPIRGVEIEWAARVKSMFPR